MSNYTAYHVHTDYSLLDSCTKFEEYVDLAVEQGMKAIASTEHGKPLGWVGKKLYCESKGIKFIHGVEIYLTEQLEPKVRDNFHTVLLAKNLDGVHELNELISRSSREDHFYYTNRISFDEFLGISDNIIKTSACLASPLNKLQDDHPRYMEIANHYDYLEIQPHVCDDQIEFNKRLFKLSKKIGKPLIAGTDTHNSSKYKAECRNILMIRKDKSYGNEDAFDLTWKTYDELVDMFKKQNAIPIESILEAIENTNVVADSVEDFEVDRSIKYPILYGSREKDSEKFVELIWNRFDEKVRNGVIPKNQVESFKDAINEELRVFQKLKMDGFMLSMSELITWCKQHNMAIGTARGSVGGSRIAYVIDIIDLNPETWHTVFSRFCNENREEIGDIDIDCIESDRPMIFKYITDRFGSEHTARVASFGTNAELATIDDIGGAFAKIWAKQHPDEDKKDNTYSIERVNRIKKLYSENKEDARKQYPELFYYFDGMLGTRVSQSVHPAGMVISPLNMEQEYGMFNKDGDNCLLLDMDELHEVGAAKYDFLVLKTVQVIRDTCRYIGTSYPKTHEIDWNDQKVWNDMLKSPIGIFQMESAFAFDSLKKFRPKNIFDMSLVTASIRPSGASYRDALLNREIHKNPSDLIDNLLKNNNGFLVYQEDIIAFLQQVCGLTGSQADTVRRGIARKKVEILDEQLPKILDGYCNNSDKPREEAEAECKEFLQIIEDASSYMFGLNHSIAYCLLGYLCAYYRYYYPIEFITSFLNNAANDDDTQSGTVLAKIYGIKVTSPKYGVSRGNYSFDKEKKQIAKGLASVKYIGEKMSNALYDLSKEHDFNYFSDLLIENDARKIMDSRQLEILTSIDFFDQFGHQRELESIAYMCDMFKYGSAKQIKKERVNGSYFDEIIKKYSVGKTKSGADSANYVFTDIRTIIRECEEKIKSMNLPDIGIITKVRKYNDALGYYGYVSGKEEDRPVLVVKDVYPLKRRRDGVQFGYSVITQSIGSGIETRFTVRNKNYNVDPIKKEDIIRCLGYERDDIYFTMTRWKHIRADFDPMDELETDI